MSKYNPLAEHLAASPGDEWLASFSEVEVVLGFPLPKAARSGRAWWANDPAKPHSRSWTERGWEVGDVDHAAERVVFRRAAASGVALQRPAGLKPMGETARSDVATRVDAPGALLVAEASIAEPVVVEPRLETVLPKADADPASGHTLLSRSLYPAAMLSAGLMVTATLTGFMLRWVLRRR